MAASDDGETVDAFLERIASLKIKRDREDEERTRKLEEEILQGRRERQARRAERARSLSPPKEPTPNNSLSFANSPSNPTLSQSIQPPVDLRPSPRPKPAAVEAAMDRDSPAARDHATPSELSRPLPVPRNTSPTRPMHNNATALSRSGTLSWQQRPSSRDSNSSRSRPVSGVSTELASPRTSEQTKPEQVEELSRAEIAQSLGSKDPTWFRQTADRGLGSAAFRRNQEDPLRDTKLTEERMRLPGMSRESTAEPEKPPFPESGKTKAASPMHDGSNQGASRQDDPFRTSYSTAPAPRSPLPFSSSQRLVPTDADTQDELPAHATEHVPAPSKALPDRPASPTKGLGGFVQSAMMKRSDSVNKRLSTQAAPGLKRGNSIAGQRGTLGNLAPVPLTRAGSPPRESKSSIGPHSSPSTHSRPGSSHSTSNVSSKHHDTLELTNGPGSFKLDSHSTEAAQKLDRGTEVRKEGGEDSFRSTNSHQEPPSSPTKTMDPKRWSPTKASWLESALSKPESPKVMSPKVEQPTWRSDLLKSKQSSMDSNETKPPKPSFEVVTQPGLMRSPPPGRHSQSISIGGLPEGFSSGLVKKAPVIQPKPSSPPQDSVREFPPRNEAPAKQPSGATITTGADFESHSSTKQGPAQGLGAAKSDSNAHVEQPPDSASKEKPPALKPKPQAPPTTDFRANLKPRQKDSQESSSAEPEFKNVFGKLRRTETKNYVAPDVLKTNILSGKAALNLTGGPQKTKKTDEFKESILSQKEAMKAGGGSINKRNETAKDSAVAVPKPVPAVPEALARRRQLSKPPGMVVGSTDAKPVAQPSIGSKPVVKLPSDLPKKAPMSTESKTAEISEEGSRSLDLPEGVASISLEQKQLNASTRLASAEPSDKVGSGKLANRMNPALASILMRGPPSNTSSRNQSTEDLSTSIASSARAPAGASQDPSEGQLTHMTKGRAKGPKRRLPKNEAASKEEEKAKPVVAAKSPQVRKVSSPRPQSGGGDGASGTSPDSSNSILSPLPARPLATLMNQNEKAKPSISKPSPKPDTKLVEDPETSNKPKPVVAAKSPDLRRVSSPRSQPAGPDDAVSITASPASSLTSPLATTTSSLSKHAMDRETAPNAASTAKDTKGDRIRNEARPDFVPKRQMPEKSMVEAVGGLGGLGLNLADSKPVRSNVSKPEPTPPEDKSFGKRPGMTGSRKPRASASTQAEERAPTAAAGPAVSKMLNEFFDERPRSSDKAETDAHAVVSSNALPTEKTKTLRMQMWEVNGDGKRQDMPPQQEHILFEDSMYLCVHSLESAKGSKSAEAFLWCGDNVGEAAVEDAQLFCRKIARENGAKLELLKQGKETASFIQALGGIIITRRSKSSALYMLCGRRHLGHVSFDEVDIDANNMCSGFPYLISARFGRLYLWKGKGSSADELGCARLIGMDLGLTGEIEEVNEGEEPSSFWDAALGANRRAGRPKWSDHWTLRGMTNQHLCRLFQIELDQPKLAASFWSRRGSSPAKATKTGLVKEITPFCQSDLEASHIFVLDAYFEIYVFVGALASSKSAEFVTALFFAQEYGILAASIQDRPRIPPCHVAFADAPPDFRTTFRKWTPTPSKGAGDGPTPMPLEAAIEALA